MNRSGSITTSPGTAIRALDEAVSTAGLNVIGPVATEKFRTYLDLILKWNARINLTAVRESDEIVRRHFVECIACAQALPASIGTLLDFGSGGGFPGIPIAICRAEIAVTLAESQNRKAAFLRESVRQIGLRSQIFFGRAEELTDRFDCVTLRAVDRMEQAVSVAARLLMPGGHLAVMTTCNQSEAIERAVPELSWKAGIPLPGSNQRILQFGQNV